MKLTCRPLSAGVTWQGISLLPALKVAAVAPGVSTTVETGQLIRL
jgi:hypothetical protein